MESGVSCWKFSDFLCSVDFVLSPNNLAISSLRILVAKSTVSSPSPSDNNLKVTFVYICGNTWYLTNDVASWSRNWFLGDECMKRSQCEVQTLHVLTRDFFNDAIDQWTFLIWQDHHAVLYDISRELIY